MEMKIDNIHGRINMRANLRNKQKAFGLNQIPLFVASISFISGEPVYEELRSYQYRCGKSVLYN